MQDPVVKGTLALLRDEWHLVKTLYLIRVAQFLGELNPEHCVEKFIRGSIEHGPLDLQRFNAVANEREEVIDGINYHALDILKAAMGNPEHVKTLKGIYSNVLDAE